VRRRQRPKTEDKNKFARGRAAFKRAGKAAVPPDEMMFSSWGSKVNPSYLADSTALCGCSVVGVAPITSMEGCFFNRRDSGIASFRSGSRTWSSPKKNFASRVSAKVSTFAQFSALAAT
jgi:hypothetical protein